MKKFVFAFFTLIIAFIVSATLFGDYHSALSVIIGVVFGLGYAWILNKGVLDKI